MKHLILVLFFILTTISCNKTDEIPLLLPSAAEPSAKLFNDRGIEYFYKGKYTDALISFTQANVVDNTAGEIHFNLGLIQHLKGNENKAKNLFRQAKYFADENIKILESKLLKQYLGL